MNAEDVRDVVVMTGACVLGSWVAAVLRASAEAAGVEVVSGDRDNPADDPGRQDGPRRLLLMESADRRLMAVIAGGRCPVIAVLDDPVDSVRFLLASEPLDFLHALRRQTRNAAAHFALCGNPSVLLVERGVNLPARALVDRLARHAQLPLSPEQVGAVADRFAGDEADAWPLEKALEQHASHHAPLSSLKDRISADEASVVRQVLSPVVLGAVTPDIGTITWVSKTLLNGDKPDEVAPAVAEITGAARILFYGPYFHLPPGEWTVRILLGFSPESKGTRFLLTMFSKETPIAKVLIQPEDGGAFEGVFSLRHVAPEQHLEIHFRTEEGMIEGHVAFGQMMFRRERFLQPAV